MLMNEDKQELVIAATQSLSDEYRNKPPIPVGQSVSGLAVRDRKTLSIKDVQSDPRYAYPDVARKEGLRSLLCVPMMVQDKILGVLNLYTTEVRDFPDEEIRLLQTIANQAAAAIQNTRLLTEAIKMREALETRKLIERAKGILQKELGLSEDKAFRMVQKKSMDSCKPMKEIAEAIVLASEMRGEGRSRKPAS
jgi:GAF domain-containing protein